MNSKFKKILRKVIYFILFALMILAFVYFGEKYADNSKDKVLTISDYYENIDDDYITVIGSTKMINYLKNGNNIILIGSSTSSWSKAYIEKLNVIFKDNDVDKIYYYDLDNDKTQKNSSYYDIRELLKGNLITTDGSNNNLLAPSLYIINDGKVLYYNVDTVAMKNTISVDEYWNEEKTEEFTLEINEALSNYYLNN